MEETVQPQRSVHWWPSVHQDVQLASEHEQLEGGIFIISPLQIIMNQYVSKGVSIMYELRIRE